MNRIKYYRQLKNMKQTEVAEAVHVSQAALSGYELGKYEPSFDILVKISEVLGVSVSDLLGQASAPGVSKVPVLGDVAAGIPIDAITDIIDYEEVDAKLASMGELFGLRVKGNSMEPKISEGDVVIVRQCHEAENGSLCVVLVNGENATIKRVRFQNNGLWLIASNPAYEPKWFSAEEVESLPVRIIGQVIELRAKFI